MSNLKDIFENYSPQPDSHVWDSIEATLRHRAVVRRRRIVGTTVAAVTVAAVVVVGLLTNRQDSATLVAENETATTTIMQNPQTSTTDINVVEDQNLTSPVTVAERQQEESIPSSATDAVESEATTVAVAKTDDKQSTTADVQSVVVRQSSTSAPVAPVNTNHPSQSGTDARQASADNDNIVPSGNFDTETLAESGATTTELVLTIPNAFSPDDPATDEVRRFKVFVNNPTSLLSYEIFIFNRAGQMVFHSKDINQTWDGTYKGSRQPMGAYVYVIEYNEAGKGVKRAKGTITLLR